MIDSQMSEKNQLQQFRHICLHICGIMIFSFVLNHTRAPFDN